MQKSFGRGVLLVLAAAVMWGISGVCGQYLFQNYHTNASWLITVRQLLVGLAFLIYLRLRGRDILAVWRNKQDAKELLIFIFGGLLGAQYGFYYTISLANAATATVLQYIAPALVLVWMAFKERRWPEGREILGLLLTVTGVFLISTHGHLNQLVISPATLVWGLLSAVAMAIHNVQPMRLLQKYRAIEIIGWGELLSGAFLSLFFNPFNPGAMVWQWQSLTALTYIIIGGTLIPFAFFLMGLSVIGPTPASMISCAEPLASILCVVLVLHTPLTLIDLSGMFCIIATVLLLSRRRV